MSVAATSILGKRSRVEESEPPTYTIDSNWVTPSRLRNYLLKDPLIDWLLENNAPFVVRYPAYTTTISKAINEPKSVNSFTEFIMQQGRLFENRVMDLLYKEFGADVIAEIGGELNSKSPDKVRETLDAMNKGVPIIHSGLLHNQHNRTYGVPDLLVRSDWINVIVGSKHMTPEEKKISAPTLRDVHHPNRPPLYHYIVVDIKFSTLHLRADGKCLLNSGSIPAYKGQVWVYNEALGHMQGYKPRKAYLLGRKWNYTSKGETFKGNSCFDRLGEVDFEGVDSEYAEKTQSAIQWIRDVRSPEARNWDVFSIPLCREELYPNMSNTNDYPWHGVKEQIAQAISELTTLWMVGPKNRTIAHEAGVYSWKDPACTVDTLGFKGYYTCRILSQILSINQNPGIAKVRPRHIQSNLQGWHSAGAIEFYVDMETVNDVLSDFSVLPVAEASSIIFMIGVGYSHPETKKWVFRCFTVDSLSLGEEGRICKEFSDYIKQESEWFECKNPLMVHWANAEQWWWDEAVERHSPASSKWIEGSANTIGPRWFDMLKLFKEEPIVIQGCFGFGLKAVAKALHSHGLIDTVWDEGSSCLDGRGAMIGAYNCHNEAKKRGTKMSTMPAMKEIQTYNEVDVKTLYEIITYLRDEHVSNREADVSNREADVPTKDTVSISVADVVRSAIPSTTEEEVAIAV